MSNRINTEVDVVNWEVEEYQADWLTLIGLNEEGDEVVRRHYKLQEEKTEVKAGADWVPLNDIDDGGFPPEARFIAFNER